MFSLSKTLFFTLVTAVLAENTQEMNLRGAATMAEDVDSFPSITDSSADSENLVLYSSSGDIPDDFEDVDPYSSSGDVPDFAFQRRETARCRGFRRSRCNQIRGCQFDMRDFKCYGFSSDRNLCLGLNRRRCRRNPSCSYSNGRCSRNWQVA